MLENSGIVIGNDPDTQFGTGEDDITLTAASIRAVADGTNARVDFDVQQTPWEVDGSTAAPTGGIYAVTATTPRCWRPSWTRFRGATPPVTT